jgi:hypothetical protein
MIRDRNIMLKIIVAEVYSQKDVANFAMVLLAPSKMFLRLSLSRLRSLITQENGWRSGK